MPLGTKGAVVSLQRERQTALWRKRLWRKTSPVAMSRAPEALDIGLDELNNVYCKHMNVQSPGNRLGTPAGPQCVSTAPSTLLTDHL